MKSKRGRGEQLVERALDSLSQALTESGAPWMIGDISYYALCGNLAILYKDSDTHAGSFTSEGWIPT